MNDARLRRELPARSAAAERRSRRSPSRATGTSSRPATCSAPRTRATSSSRRSPSCGRQNTGPVGTLTLLANLGRHTQLEGIGLDDLYTPRPARPVDRPGERPQRRRPGRPGQRHPPEPRTAAPRAVRRLRRRRGAREPLARQLAAPASGSCLTQVVTSTAWTPATRSRRSPPTRSSRAGSSTAARCRPGRPAPPSSRTRCTPRWWSDSRPGASTGSGPTRPRPSTRCTRAGTSWSRRAPRPGSRSATSSRSSTPSCATSPTPRSSMFPTKALAQDQLRSLRSWLVPGLHAVTYDGDTPPDDRAWARKNANVVLTNPEMLHQGILPYHRRWATFLMRLRLVVVDELHSLRGIFGSNVAHVLRRLQRVCAHYGSSPSFCFASATIGNPAELAHALCGQPVTAIDDDGSPQSERCFGLWQRPLLDEHTGRRSSANAETAELLSRFVRDGRPTLAFTRSRRGAELVAAQARRRLQPDDRRSPDRGRRVPRRLPARGAARARTPARRRQPARRRGDERARARHRRRRARRGRAQRLPRHARVDAPAGRSRRAHRPPAPRPSSSPATTSSTSGTPRTRPSCSGARPRPRS